MLATVISAAPAPESVRALEDRAEVRLVDTAHGKVCWRRFGGGPPLALLHGGHGSWLHWVRNIDSLAQRFTLWVPDMPGYGDSASLATGALAPLVHGLRESMDSLVGPDTPVRMAGFSFGGLVAAHLAQQRPGIVQLALLGSAGHSGRRRPRGKLRNWQVAATDGDSAALAEVMRHNLSVHMLHAQPPDIDDVALYVHTRSALHTRFRSKEISRAGGLQAVLDTLATRLLLAWGEHDVTAEPHKLVREVAASHPDRQAIIIEGAGHWVQYERPESVNDLLLRWLA